MNGEVGTVGWGRMDRGQVPRRLPSRVCSALDGLQGTSAARGLPSLPAMAASFYAKSPSRRGVSLLEPVRWSCVLLIDSRRDFSKGGQFDRRFAHKATKLHATFRLVGSILLQGLVSGLQEVDYG